MGKAIFQSMEWSLSCGLSSQRWSIYCGRTRWNTFSSPFFSRSSQEVLCSWEQLSAEVSPPNCAPLGLDAFVMQTLLYATYVSIVLSTSSSSGFHLPSSFNFIKIKKQTRDSLQVRERCGVQNGSQGLFCFLYDFRFL